MKSLSIRWAIFYSHDQKLWVSGQMVPHRAVWALDVLERWRSIWVYLCLWKDCWPNNLDVISSAKLKIGEVRWGQIQDMFSKFVARSFRTCPVHQLQPKRWIFELCEWQHFAQHNRNSRSPQNPKQRHCHIDMIQYGLLVQKLNHAARNDPGDFHSFFCYQVVVSTTLPGFCVQSILCRLAFRMVFAWLRNRFHDFTLEMCFFRLPYVQKNWTLVVFHLQVFAKVPSCFNWASFGTLHLQTKLYI